MQLPMQHIFSNKNVLHEELGEFIADCSKQAIEERGRFTIGFSGGSAATNVCECMSHEKYSETVDWSKWFVFFCDERFVDSSSPDSNYKAVHDGLLGKKISEGAMKENQIFKLDVKAGGVSGAARVYEREMQKVFGKESLPEFDLLILGMGPDGHICSLFPKHRLLDERKKWIAFLEDSPKPPPKRITMTLNVVNNAKKVVFYTTGQGKAENIRKAIQDKPSKDVPASLVNPTKGRAHWFMDFEAASQLK